MKFTDLKKIPTDQGKIWIGLAIIFAMYGGAKLLSLHPRSGIWALVVAAALFFASLQRKLSRRAERPAQVETYKLFEEDHKKV